MKLSQIRAIVRVNLFIDYFKSFEMTNNIYENDLFGDVNYSFSSDFIIIDYK